MSKSFAFVAFLCGVVSASSASITYSITDIGLIAGEPTFATSINNSAQVVGYTNTSPNRPFIWTEAVGAQYLAHGGTGTYYTREINAMGFTAGYHARPDGQVDGKIWTSATSVSTLPTLGGLNTWAYGINDAGTVVGTSSFSNDLRGAFRWTQAGGMQDLGSLGGFNSSANAINASGMIVGESSTQGYSFNRAFLWTESGGMVSLGSNNGVSSSATDINDNGSVVGIDTKPNGYQGGFLWTQSGGMIDLGNLTGDFSSGTAPRAINNSGTVVGDAFDRFLNVTPFVWNGSVGMQRLDSLLDASGQGWTLFYAADINDNGQIVGTGFYDGEVRAFLLTPSTVPEPGTMVALGAGALALVRRRRNAQK